MATNAREAGITHTQAPSHFFASVRTAGWMRSEDHLEALRELLLQLHGVLDRRGDHDVVAVLPVHGRRHAVLVGELEAVEDAQDLLEVPARRRRIGDHRANELLRVDEEDRPDGELRVRLGVEHVV